jgi:hypothetical protein
MAREVATAYTGSNVSLFLGDELIVNAFGISYELSQNKRPIYGYNSLYFDAVSHGQVIVLGQLYINFQHPNYLSSLLVDHFKNGSSTLTDIVEIEKKITEKLIDLSGNSPNTATGYAQDNVLSANASLISAIFENKTLFNRAKALLSGGKEGVQENLPITTILTAAMRGDATGRYSRPDQFTDNSVISTKTNSSRKPINIVIAYGDPGYNPGSTVDFLEGDYQSSILAYNPSVNVILKDIHFIGESQQVMADDQPVMEVYKFMARSKEIVPVALDPTNQLTLRGEVERGGEIGVRGI